VADELRGDRVVLRPITAPDVPVLRAALQAPEVARWWGAEQARDGWPWTDDPDAVRYAVVVDGRVAGMIQYAEEDEPDFRSAGIDLYLHPDWHGRGLGTDAVRTVARHLVRDRGHHRLTIDPAADNTAAIRCYTKVGFRPVGVLRRYWRDPAGSWRDGLLMDLLADELR
jgi:aminoglycoside 6'-N-acetyltransferase